MHTYSFCVTNLLIRTTFYTTTTTLADDVSLGWQQPTYTFPENVNTATICIQTNIPLQRDGIVALVSTNDGTARGMLMGETHD